MLYCGVPFFPKDLDFSYCSRFGGEELDQLLPLSETLKRLSLKGTHVGSDAIVSYLEKANRRTGPSCLESLDLSAVTKDGSTHNGDTTAQAISVSTQGENGTVPFLSRRI